MELKLTDLLRREEGKTLEFKRDLSSTDKVLQTLTAFANTAGGILLVGIDDGSKAVRGLKRPAVEAERLANIISHGIVPLITPAIEVLTWRKTNVLAVEVTASLSRPCHLVREGPERGIYVRVGSTNRRADAVLIAELRRTAMQRTFDEEPAAGANSEAIDFRAASGFFAPYRKLRPADGETLGLATRAGRRVVPTNGGIILFGRQREKYFPDAWLQCGRFSGTSKAHIADTAEYRDHLPVLAERALAFVKKHATRAWAIRGVRRTEQWSVPLVALREAVINALVHADYSQRGGPIRVSCFDDRIEIENPGLLPFGLRTEDLFHGVSVIRNRVIARVFKELELIEQWGSGVQRMLESCTAAGLPAPNFAEIGFRFRVTFPLHAATHPILDEKDRTILALLAQDAAGMSTAALSRRVGLTLPALRARLKRLIVGGTVVVVGKGLNDPRRRYLRREGGNR